MGSATITITLGQLFTFLLGILGIVFFVVICILLLKVKEILDQINKIIVKNEKNIDESIESLPKVLNNVEQISGVVNEEVKHLQGVVKNIEETVGYTAATAQGISEDILEPIGDLFQIISLITGILPIKKKKSWFKK